MITPSPSSSTARDGDADHGRPAVPPGKRDAGLEPSLAAGSRRGGFFFWSIRCLVQLASFPMEHGMFMTTFSIRNDIPRASTASLKAAVTFGEGCVSALRPCRTLNPNRIACTCRQGRGFFMYVFLVRKKRCDFFS